MSSGRKISKIRMIRVGDIMTEQVVVINEKMMIGQVAHLMLRERVSGYPIVDDGGKVIGIVTLTDLFILMDKMVAQSAADTEDEQHDNLQDIIVHFKEQPISVIMSKNVVTVDSATKLVDIVHTVVESKMHTFPVMENGKLIGILGRHDVLNATFSYA